VEFGVLVFVEGEKNGNPGEKPSEQDKNQLNQINPHMATGWIQTHGTVGGG